MRHVRAAALAASVGYVLFYFSELLFWARPRAEDSSVQWLWVWLTYSLAAYVALWLAWRFSVRSWWAMFLVGAAYGFTIEGVIVATMYEAPPLSISFTPLAWHALVSVMVGWWAIDRAVRRGRTLPFVWIGLVGGLAYGVWAINWWVEEGDQVPVGSFAAYSFAPAVLLIGAYLVSARLMGEGFSPTRPVTGVVVSLLAVQYVVTGLFVTWLALVVLPPLAWLIWWALSRSASATGHGLPAGPYRIAFPTRIRQLAWFLALPAVAVAVYAAAYGAGVEAATNQAFYAILMPAGFVAYGFAIARAVKAARAGVREALVGREAG